MSSLNYEVVQWLLNTIKPKLKAIILILVVSLSGMILDVIQPLLWGKLLAQLFENKKDLYFVLILGVAGVFLLTKLIRVIEFVLTQKVSSKLLIIEKMRIYRSIYRSDYKRISNFAPGELLNRVESDVDQCISGFIAIVASSIINLLKIVVLLIIISSLNIGLTLLIFGGSLLITIITEFLNRRFKHIDSLFKMENDTYFTFSQQLISSISEVRILGVAIEFCELYHQKAGKFYDKKVKNGIFHMGILTLVDLLNFFIDLLVMIVGGYMVFNNKLKVEHYIAFTMYTRQFYFSFKNLLQNFVNFQKISNSVNRIKELTDDSVHIQNLQYFTNGDIQFRNFSFNYNKMNVINKLSFTIYTPGAIGLVGENGSGKSTLINSLLGLYSDYSGSIHIDGVDILHIDKKSFYDKISVVSQNPFLFNLSIKENITLFDENISSERLNAVCKLVEVHDDICKLENGYNTILNNNGSVFSKGQHKKIALARCLIKNSHIVVLDEATSNIDTKSMNKILRNIIPMFSDRTLIIVSHNEEVLKQLDRVFFLSSGEINAVGRHEDLIDENLEYKELFVSS